MAGYGSTSIRATHPAPRLGSPGQVDITRQEVRTCGFAALCGTDKPTVVMLPNSLSSGLVCAEPYIDKFLFKNHEVFGLSILKVKFWFTYLFYIID
jgi:hypothetical protein